MEPYEDLVGITVRVKKAHWNPGFAGMRGTIERRFGDPEYPAFDVRLEDGGLELFWFHQLDRAEGPIHAALRLSRAKRVGAADPEARGC